jgi:hypothetical protein
MGLLDRLLTSVTRMNLQERGEHKAARKAQRNAERAAWEAHRARCEERLVKAAGISWVSLVCHRDTWDFICRMVQSDGVVFGPRLTSQDPVVPLENGRVRVTLSGSNLVKVLAHSWEISGSGYLAKQSVIAMRIYQLVAAAVDAMDPDTTEKNPPPPILIDDQIPAAAGHPGG